jgi:DNA-binding CsgD family transcriptional regulator
MDDRETGHTRGTSVGLPYEHDSGQEATGGIPSPHEMIPRPRLTDRELTVLELAASGLTSRQIAARLFVCPQTITYHMGNLFVKFRVTGRVELVAKSFSLGLFASGTWPPTLWNIEFRKTSAAETSSSTAFAKSRAVGP